jgi:hypothetical protein
MTPLQTRRRQPPQSELRQSNNFRTCILNREGMRTQASLVRLQGADGKAVKLLGPGSNDVQRLATAASKCKLKDMF